MKMLLVDCDLCVFMVTEEGEVYIQVLNYGRNVWHVLRMFEMFISLLNFFIYSNN